MTPDQFRSLALSLPAVEEGSHMGHAEFRIGGKIFATLGAPDKHYAMVKLTPDQQEEWIDSHPDMFIPVKGGWGLRGATHVILAAAKTESVRGALIVAWKNTAPKRIAKQYEDL